MSQIQVFGAHREHPSDRSIEAAPGYSLMGALDLSNSDVGPDSSIAGYDIGFDDWAEAATKERAEEILAGWGFAP